MPTLGNFQFINCLWFDGKAEEAANFYVSIFPNSRVTHVERQPLDEDVANRGRPPFELDGHRFLALNGGPDFKPNAAISLQIEV
jgi:predicted 3-demethylubiquinone-9 3-methyltransferase (glyoxalase superfamily)